jgi:hypothetical protein
MMTILFPNPVAVTLDETRLRGGRLKPAFLLQEQPPGGA